MALENLLGRTDQMNFRKISKVAGLVPNLEFAAFGLDRAGSYFLIEDRKGDGTGGDAGSAGEGLVFYAAFVGAYTDLVGPFSSLHKIYVDTPR